MAGSTNGFVGNGGRLSVVGSRVGRNDRQHHNAAVDGHTDEPSAANNGIEPQGVITHPQGEHAKFDRFESGPGRTRSAVTAFLRQQVEKGRWQIDNDRLSYAAVQFLNTALGMY